MLITHDPIVPEHPASLAHPHCRTLLRPILGPTSMAVIELFVVEGVEQLTFEELTLLLGVRPSAAASVLERLDRFDQLSVITSDHVSVGTVLSARRVAAWDRHHPDRVTPVWDAALQALVRSSPRAPQFVASPASPSTQHGPSVGDVREPAESSSPATPS